MTQRLKFTSIAVFYAVILLLKSCHCTPPPLIPTLPPKSKMEDVKPRSSKSRGIPSIGNSCYMNSALQAIAAFYKKEIMAAGSTDLDTITKDFIKDLTSSATIPETILRDKAKKFFNKAKAELGLQFSDGAQEDASELLLALLDHFKVAQVTDAVILTNPTTKKQRFQKINWRIKSLNINNADRGKTMQAIFETNILPEKVELRWQNQDLDNIEVTKQIRFTNIESLPILPIQLVRFSFDKLTAQPAKINVNITDPFHLIIKKEFTTSGLKDISYNLVGFIQHLGSTMKNGHYTSYIKEEGKWKLYDDNTVIEKTDAEAEKAAGQAYLFFYQPQKP